MAMTTGDDQIALEPDVFAFTLRLAGAAEITDLLENALFEAGCDDALLRQCDGQLFLDFDRESPTVTDAIVSAIKAVEGSQVGLTVAEVIPPGGKEISSINAVLCARRDEGLLKSLEKPR